MHLRQFKYLLPVAALTMFGVTIVAGQTPDTSGNALLKGTFQFRHVAVLNVDDSYNPSEIAATFGAITFDGAGHYSIAGTTLDNTVANGSSQPFASTGTYAIGSSGAGYIANPLAPTDFNLCIYGAVSQGVYTGSSTEAFGDSSIMNDIFIAIPASSSPTNAGFTSPYQTGLLDFTGAGSTAIKNALFELSPNGSGGFGAISLTGQAANQVAATLTQSITGATYNFNSGGSATLTIPLPSGVSATNALFTGSKTIYESADGNFILGWTAGGYDIFFGVKALTVTGTNSLSTGLYFTSALEDSPGGFGFGTDSYYGGINNTGDTAGDGIVHERLNYPLEYSFDNGTDDLINLSANGTVSSPGSADTDYNGYEMVFGDGGQAFVAIGTNGNFSLLVGMHAAAFSGPGVYLNPIGVANAASLQPVTASIAPGELLILVGTGLSSGVTVTQGGQVFPTTLSNVTVSINNIPCPIYYVTPTQLAVAVPFAVASNQTGLANIQVTNNKVSSNVVQVYLTDAAPGSFSQGADGIGYAAANHAATGQLITPGNPAQPSEYISLYLTGLGTVTPTITDGAVGPSGPLSWSDVYGAGNLAVNFFDTVSGDSETGAISFAGLAPTLAGLYQINVQVPASGLTSGDNVYVVFSTDAANELQIQIPFGLGAPAPLVRKGGPLAKAALIKAIRSQPKKQVTHRTRGVPVGAGS